MLTHIVIWKYSPEVDEETRQEHRQKLRALPSFISNIESFVVGKDMLKLPRSYDTGLVAVFKNREALDAYTVDPEHVKVAAFGREISEHVASVDFED